MTKGVTKADIARAAGVTRSAVSMVLNGRPNNLAAATAERIRQTARRMGYEESPRLSVRSVALIAQGEQFFDPVDDFFQGVARSLWAGLSDRDYNVVTGFLEGREHGEIRLPRVLRDGGVDGFAVIVADTLGYRAVETCVARLGARAVFAAWRHDDAGRFGWVASDDPGGSRSAAEEVARLGHTRVAVISAVGTGNPAARERLAGCVAALAERGVSVPERWTADAGWTHGDGRAAMSRILDAPGPPPTAVLCANDWQALGAMDEARARGLDVPADISVVGFDGCDAALRDSAPSIATVEHDLDSMGRATARALLDWIEGRVDAPPTVRIPARFRPGGSLAAPRGGGEWRGDHERA